MRSFDYSDHSVVYHRHIKWICGSFALMLVVLLFLYKYNPFGEKPKLAIDKFYFKPVTEDGKQGYPYLVDALLAKYVNEPSLRKIDFRALVERQRTTVLMTGDSSLSFYCPIDGDLQALRLIGIHKFRSPEDSMFYHNSLLSNHLQLQATYPDRKIFDLDFDIENEHWHLIRIKIDRNILAVPLVPDNHFWKEPVVADVDSLFNGALFLKLGHVWLPVMPLAGDSSGQINPYGAKTDGTLDYFHFNDQFGLLKDILLHNKTVYQIMLGRGQFIECTRSKDSLYLFYQNIAGLQVTDDQQVMDINIRKGVKQAIALYNFKRSFEIRFTGDLHHTVGNIYCTADNPFSILSQSVMHNRKGYRRAASREEVDVFANMMAREIPNVENMFSDLGSRKMGMPKSTPISLGYNPVLGKFLEEEIGQYIHTNGYLKTYEVNTKEQSIRMGIVVMNTANAAVLAAPWYDGQMKKTTEYKNLVNYNLINHPIGSCFKPLLYFTSFRRFPTLSKLVLKPEMVSSFADFAPTPKGKKHKDVTILGYPTKSFFGDTKGAGENLTWAMARSSNLFPAITHLYAVTENNPAVFNKITQEGPFPCPLYTEGQDPHTGCCAVIDKELYMNGLGKNAVTDLYKVLYDVEDIDLGKGKKDFYEYAYWDHSNVMASGKPDVKLRNYGALSPMKVTLRFDFFNATDHEERKGNFRGDVVSWILGSQNNHWNNMKLCEALTRVITGVHNRGSLRKPDQGIDTLSLFKLSASVPTLTSYPNVGEFAEAHQTLLESMNHQKQVEGSTWSDIGSLVQQVRVPGISSPLLIFAKTGTANDEDKPYSRNLHIHRGAFMFTIMTEEQYKRLQLFIIREYDPRYYPATLGITGVISLEMIDRASSEAMFYSKFARGFLGDKERLTNLVKLNRHLFR